MKTFTKILLCLCGITLLPLVLSATKDQTVTPTYVLPRYELIDFTLPIPEKVITPRVNGEFVGAKVRMELIIGKDGRPRNIHMDGVSPDARTNDLASTMKMVLPSWRFQPGLDKAGNPVAVKIILPVEVVKAKKHTRLYTAIALAKPIFLARVN